NISHKNDCIIYQKKLESIDYYSEIEKEDITEIKEKLAEIEIEIVEDDKQRSSIEEFEEDDDLIDDDDEDIVDDLDEDDIEKELEVSKKEEKTQKELRAEQRKNESLHMVKGVAVEDRKSVV